MAWTCSGRTNKELIARMVEAKLLKSDRVAAAMGATDRAAYVRYKSDAYVDSPQTIGYGATISAPHMHAHAAENLLSFLFPGAKVLDVGSGSGYTAAIFHRLVCADGTKGSVVGIEHIPELSEWSVANLRADGLGKALEDGEIIMFAGDGRQGSLEHAPFDAIHVGAAAPTIPPALVEQLAKPGRMFIPVGTDEQAIMQVDKDAQGNVTEKRLFGVMYVPLTDRAKQWTGS